jgi:signal peptidase II
MLLMLLVCAAVIAADQISKALVTARGAFHVINSRRGWGSRPALRVRAAAWLLLSTAAIVLTARTDAAAADIGAGAIVGGSAGNLIDALRGRGVTDFIDLRVWPVFNLADAAIVGGAVLAASTLFGWSH